MNKIKVTQVRSIIGRDETQKRTIQALGLGKINRSRVHNDTPAIRGMINKVRHLVTIEDVAPESGVNKEEQQAVKTPIIKTAQDPKKAKSTKSARETDLSDEKKKADKKAEKKTVQPQKGEEAEKPATAEEVEKKEAPKKAKPKKETTETESTDQD